MRRVQIETLTEKALNIYFLGLLFCGFGGCGSRCSRGEGVRLHLALLDGLVRLHVNFQRLVHHVETIQVGHLVHRLVPDKIV